MTAADSLGDRMKVYEARETERVAMPTLPLYARLDGRNFHAFTRGMDAPFDKRFAEVMVEVTRFLVARTLPLIGYTQSDEISLAWMQKRSDSQLLFGGRLFKITSCLASLATARFLQLAQEIWPTRCQKTIPTFDARCFSLPNREELANMFLWRERDATKNAVSMATHSYYGPKELDRKSGPAMQEMLFAKGVNFNDYHTHFKRGTFCRHRVITRELTAEEIARIPPQYRPAAPVALQRTEIVTIDMPSFDTVTNRADVICDGAEPISVTKEDDVTEEAFK